jgi:four helix bundle protein
MMDLANENKKENVLVVKSFEFAIKVVNTYKYLTKSKGEFILSKQFLRSGTSIGALVRESQNAESKMDFVHKLAIAQKECDETIYWIDILIETKYLDNEEFKVIKKDAESLLRIIRSIILTTKNNINRK